LTNADLPASNRKIFLQNRLAAAGLLLIVLTSLVAVLGYLITPDDTPQANGMLVQLSLKKPGAAFTLLRIEKEGHIPTVNFLQKMLFGQPSPWRNIPITSFRFSADSIYVREYIGEEEVSAETAYNIYKIGGKRSMTSGPLISNPKKEVLKEASVLAARKEITDHQILKKTYWLGTDIYGRDMLSRLIIGARISLAVGFVSVIISLVVGVSIGSAAGYFGGKTDAFLSWLIMGFAGLAAGDRYFFCFRKRFMADICGRRAFYVGRSWPFGARTGNCLKTSRIYRSGTCLGFW